MDVSGQTSGLVFEALQKYAAGEIDGQEALSALSVTAEHSLKAHYIHGSNTLWPSILQTATQIAIAEKQKK